MALGVVVFVIVSFEGSMLGSWANSSSWVSIFDFIL